MSAWPEASCSAFTVGLRISSASVTSDRKGSMSWLRAGTDKENRPGVSALLTTAALTTGRTEEEIAAEIGNDGAGAVKRYVKQIQDAYEDDRLSRAHAQRMRESVQLMQMDLEDTV